TFGQRLGDESRPAAGAGVEAPRGGPALKVTGNLDQDHRLPVTDQGRRAGPASLPAPASGERRAGTRRQRLATAGERQDQRDGPERAQPANASSAAAVVAARFTPSLSSHA